MQRTFIVNNRQYTAKQFDFNTVCDLEEQGISLDAIRKKPMSAVRAYFALCLDGDTAAAGEEIGKHLMNGGDMNVIIEAMVAELNESDFFRSLQARQTQTATAAPQPQAAETATPIVTQIPIEPVEQAVSL